MCTSGTQDAGAPILADLTGRHAGWLAEAAKPLADLVEEDWAAWTASKAGG